MNFTDSEIEDLLKGIFAGDITKENLPVDLYQSIAEFLEKGLLKGAGGPVTSFDGKDLDLIQELRTNIYMFSAAKTYQEVRTMTDLLYNEDDKVKPFDEFFEDARAIYNNYNVNYAQTEYNTAVASGQMGIRWNQIEADKEILPLLKMTVVEDAQTTEICEPLDGITLPVNDPFWDEFYPPNHWNCRSTVLQLDEGEISSKAEVDKAKEHADEDMQDVFKMNVGKDEIVFSPDHPYFKVPREDKELAKRNFDLPMPEELVNYTPTPTIEDRIEEIKTKAKELSDQIAEKQKAFDEKIAPIKLKLNDYASKLGSTSLNDPEYSKILEEWRGVSKEYDAINATRGNIREGYNKFVVNLLESKNGKAEFDLIMTKAQSKNIVNIKDGEDYFKRIVGKNVLKETDSVGVKTIKGREHFSIIDNKIAIRESSTIKTITHELGHYLEDANKNYFDKIKEFYAERTKNDKIEKLSKLLNNILSDKEITKKDNFINAYTGKWYEHNNKQIATEITSMWFSHVFEDLHNFIQKDPEHFELIFKLFNQ